MQYNSYNPSEMFKHRKNKGFNNAPSNKQKTRVLKRVFHSNLGSYSNRW